eukprot:365028-Chlamydomonas_euryale.AAC.4
MAKSCAHGSRRTAWCQVPAGMASMAWGRHTRQPPPPPARLRFALLTRLTAFGRPQQARGRQGGTSAARRFRRRVPHWACVGAAPPARSRHGVPAVVHS